MYSERGGRINKGFINVVVSKQGLEKDIKF